MFSVLRSVFSVVFVVLEFGGMILLYVRARAAQRIYLRQFDPVDGVPLDGIAVGMPRVMAAIREAMWEWQEDPTREALRRAMWARFGWVAAWIFGFPLAIAAILVTLILTGHGELLG